MMATRLYQNTARVHFNLHAEKDGRFGRRIIFGFFFFKQKTAYEISSRDWSSDVCSSDLYPEARLISRPGMKNGDTLRGI